MVDKAGVMKLVNMRDSKSRAARLVGSSPTSGTNESKLAEAYVIGVALGDGNLSNPNGRAVRLRVTCDKKYPNLIKEIRNAIQVVMPNNKVSLVNRKDNAIDVSCYSNKWPNILGWTPGKGPKHNQNISIPAWIKNSKQYARFCIRGLIQTDGSIYKDRGYLMVNLTGINRKLLNDAKNLLVYLGYDPQLYKFKTKTKHRFNLRVSKNVEKLVKELNLSKC